MAAPCSWSMSSLAFVALLLAGLTPLAAHAQPDAPSREARAVYHRFVAPCCWTESLASHDSPAATALRVEIAARLSAGESARAIEDDLVARYGERIVTQPYGIEGVSLALLGLLVAAAFGLLAAGVRGSARARVATELASAATVLLDDDLDRRLDDELARLPD